MFEKLTAIELSGANFVEKTTLNLFKPSKKDEKKKEDHDTKEEEKIVKGVLLFGRNGSGKSTIARVFKKIADNGVSTILDGVALNKDGQQIELSEEERKHIFVFDEEFVDKNVKLKEESLETIVMLGPVANLAEQMEKAIKEEKEARINRDKKEKEYKNYLDSSDLISPEYYKKSMREKLQGDNNWAGRERRINNSRKNAAVSDVTYLNILENIPQKSREELFKEFNSVFEELEKAKSGASFINDKVPSLPEMFFSYNDEEIQRLLAEKIERPELSEREKKIFAMIQNCQPGEMDDRLKILQKDDVTECPYCFQPLSSEYKAGLVDSIEKVLNKKVKEHQKALQEHISDVIPFDLEIFKKLLGGPEYNNIIQKINCAIESNNECLRKKTNNPFEAISVDNKQIKESLYKLQENLTKLEAARVSYNEEMKKTEPLLVKLTTINKGIAYYDIIEDSKRYEEQKKKMDCAEQQYKESEKVLAEKISRIADLNAERHDIKLAVKSINKYIDYIFFAKDRLKIECEDGVYKLRSRGKRVSPREVSVGERNIIGLSYFFTSIFQGKEEDDAYKEEYLLVIDDPVSSFDMENRIGIMSFLRYMLGMFLEKNRNTKALVMTHDTMAFYDIWKIFEEIKSDFKELKRNGDTHNSDEINLLEYKFYELSDNKIKEFPKKNRQEYTEILKVIYEYAFQNNNDEQQGLVIGNMMRQVLEAYATFVYRKGIENVSLDQQILEQLPPEYRLYYKNLMYRLVLHGGSHREEQVRAMHDFKSFELISKDEKIRIAKDVLCFLFLLNKVHILKHLEGHGGNVEKDLESWCKEIARKQAED